MAIYGSLGEGWTRAYGGRNGEFLFRGSQAFASAATATVTVPLPIRGVFYAMAQIASTTALAANVSLTVGNFSGNTFEVYAWENANYGSSPAAAEVTVGTSVFSYTSGTSGPAAPNGETLFCQPTSSDTFTYTITRGSVTTGTNTATSLGPVSVYLENGDIMAITWATSAPSVYSFPSPGPGGGTQVAYTNSLTFDWCAWGNLLGSTPEYNQP